MLETLITAPVPIVVDASWAPLPTNVLGSAGPTWLTPRTRGGVTSYYPYGLANQLAGYDLDPWESDVEATFSSAYTGWYMNTDGQTPWHLIDFKSVVMHEVMHGLGFVGGLRYSGGTGSWAGPYPFAYDRHAATTSGTSLLNTAAFPTPSSALDSALVGGGLQNVGPYAKRGNGGVGPRLYAPWSWAPGSSYSHLDETTYPAGDVNSLMTYQIGPGEAIHHPGPIALGMLGDMGWDVLMVPAAATGVTATAGVGSVTVRWTPPADDGGSTVTGHRVLPSAGAPVDVPAGSSSAVVPGLTPGTPVTFTVVAMNSIGDGPPSARSAAVTPTGTAAPADTAAPTLTAFDFTPKTVDVSTGDATVTVTARVTDATGAQAPTLLFRSDTTDQSAGFGRMTLTSGTAQDGTYSRTITIPQGAAPGTWSASLHPLTDTLGNSGSFGPPSSFLKTLTVNAGPPPSLPEPCASGFIDVVADHPFCDEIAWMKRSGVSTGTVMPDGSVEYRPALSVSRQAMAPFLYRALGSPAFTEPAVPTFADNTTTHPFFTEIEWMAARGISTGTTQPKGKPLYKPADPVSRNAMASFLQRAAGSQPFTAPTSPSFADVTAAHPTYAAIEWMRVTGISTGTTQRQGKPLYKPADPVSRQAMAAFLQRFDALAS